MWCHARSPAYCVNADFAQMMTHCDSYAIFIYILSQKSTHHSHFYEILHNDVVKLAAIVPNPVITSFSEFKIYSPKRKKNPAHSRLSIRFVFLLLIDLFVYFVIDYLFTISMFALYWLDDWERPNHSAMEIGSLQNGSAWH